MMHSFVVGITLEGQRVPLFVGTVGEARAAGDAANQAGGVVDGTAYRYIDVVEGTKPTSTTEHPDAAAAVKTADAPTRPPAKKKPGANAPKADPPSSTTAPSAGASNTEDEHDV